MRELSVAEQRYQAGLAVTEDHRATTHVLEGGLQEVPGGRSWHRRDGVTPTWVGLSAGSY